MERTITVYNSTTQTKTVLEHINVNTLGELKEVLSDNGIDYTNMDFQEGVSQTHLLNDSTTLPSNIEYKGRLTNDLVIFMTLKNNKVKSGFDFTTLSRVELLHFIKDSGYADAISDYFGDNYTRISSDNLRSWLNRYHSEPVAEEQPEVDYSSNIVKEFVALLDLFSEKYCLAPEHKKAILDILAGKTPEKGYSLDEIEEMQSRLDA